MDIFTWLFCILHIHVYIHVYDYMLVCRMVQKTVPKGPAKKNSMFRIFEHHFFRDTDL